MANSNQNSGSFSFITPVKLDHNNFIVWRTQILTSIKGNGLEDFINGNQVCPEKFFSATSSVAGFSTGTENQEINPAYTMWIKTDQLILSWMLSSIQPNLLTTVIHCSTAKELLDTLKSMFVSQSQARIMPLKMQIQTLKKGSMSIIDYFAKMKRISDSLALAGKPVEVNDFVQHVLIGLDSSDYESLVTIVLARGDNISLDEFYSLLLSHENRVEQKRGKVASDVTHNLSANVAQKQFNSGKNTGGNQNFNNRSYGGVYNSGAGSGDGNVSQIVCQICFIPGHSANKCRNRFNSAFIPSRNQGRGGFNGNFRPGQRQYGRGFGYANGNRASMAYGNFGRNFSPQFGAGIGNTQFGNFNSPRTPGYQGHLMYSDPAAFNVYQQPNSHGGYSPAHAFAPTGDYSGSPSSFSIPSVPVPAHAPEMFEDPAWYIDSGATDHITNDSGQELRDHFA